MPFTIVRKDITQMAVDAIVNAANVDLRMGGGVCGAIFRAAGMDEMRAACAPLAPIQTGDAVMTPAFNLPARYVIHTAGPVYRDGLSGEAQLLRACYRNSLEIADASDCRSVAFPLIASGIYGYPRAEALTVAVEAIREFLAERDLDVYLAVLDKQTIVLNEPLSRAVRGFIDRHWQPQGVQAAAPPGQANLPPQSGQRASRRRPRLQGRRPSASQQPDEKPALSLKWLEVASEAIDAKPAQRVYELENRYGTLGESFSRALLRLIDDRGLNDVDVYKRANLDRRLFSKIRSDRNYAPGKKTALALAVALELNLEETGDLLRRAGYALSPSYLTDVIVEYFIRQGRYDLYEINTALFQYDQSPLGG